ncbi:DinB family protein [Algoriphagus aquimarinus]|uniref:DinB family protein n=1 Tax=Algoriphagus aquimarinus TaxID=237018 RepID=UPI0030D9FC49
MLAKLNSEVLGELSDFLVQLKPEDFADFSPVLKTSSIGQHVRHILELYDCLLSQYESGIVCYDDRKRDKRLETDMDSALAKIKEIRENLKLEDKEIILKMAVGTDFETIRSSYNRELCYNLEHCIHHQALIKIACNQLDYLSLPSSFGVAKSTIDYVKSLESSTN